VTVTQAVIHLIGEIALLLWGIHMVHSGMVRAFGMQLRRWLGRSLKGRMRAMLAGIGVTAVLQSSTATAMMATSFVAAGVVALTPALAIMLGANIGTALIVQALSFDIGLVYPVLIFVGLVAFRRGAQTRVRDLGRVAIGLGLMLLSLHLLTGTVTPAAQSATTVELLRALTGEPLVNLALAMILTWAAHSSVAMVLAIMSLAGAGVLTPAAAAAMVLGANLGTSLNPLVDALGKDRAQLRLPLANLGARLAGVVLLLPFLPWLMAEIAQYMPGAARQIVTLHLGFNIALAVIFLPLLGPLGRLLQRWLPDAPATADPGMPLYLDRHTFAEPAVALASGAREALRLADIVESMLRGALAALVDQDRKRLREIAQMDTVLDRLHLALKLYLTELSRENLTEAEQRRLTEIMAFAINLEHIGDIIDKGLVKLLRRKLELQLSFSPEGQAEIIEMHGRLVEHLRIAVAVLMEGDLGAAARLVAEKERFRELEREATTAHFARLREGRPESVETSGLHLDLARDLKRIEAHIAATVQPRLEAAGMLRPSRLAAE